MATGFKPCDSKPFVIKYFKGRFSYLIEKIVNLMLQAQCFRAEKKNAFLNTKTGKSQKRIMAWFTENFVVISIFLLMPKCPLWLHNSVSSRLSLPFFLPAEYWFIQNTFQG